MTDRISKTLKAMFPAALQEDIDAALAVYDDVYGVAIGEGGDGLEAQELAQASANDFLAGRLALTGTSDLAPDELPV